MCWLCVILRTNHIKLNPPKYFYNKHIYLVHRFTVVPSSSTITNCSSTILCNKLFHVNFCSVIPCCGRSDICCFSVRRLNEAPQAVLSGRFMTFIMPSSAVIRLRKPGNPLQVWDNVVSAFVFKIPLSLYQSLDVNEKE